MDAAAGRGPLYVPAEAVVGRTRLEQQRWG